MQAHEHGCVASNYTAFSTSLYPSPLSHVMRMADVQTIPTTSHGAEFDLGSRV